MSITQLSLSKEDQVICCYCGKHDLVEYRQKMIFNERFDGMDITKSIVSYKKQDLFYCRRCLRHFCTMKN